MKRANRSPRGQLLGLKLGRRLVYDILYIGIGRAGIGKAVSQEPVATLRTVRVQTAVLAAVACPLMYDLTGGNIHASHAWASSFRAFACKVAMNLLALT